MLLGRAEILRVGLDRLDMNILIALQGDATMSNLQLSKSVALSPSACLTRVQRLRDQGYLLKTGSIVAVSKIGPVLYSTLEITVESHSLKDHIRFERAISEIHEVIFAIKVSGRFDYLLAMITSDMQHLSRLSDEMLGGGLGIAKLVTIPILDVVKPFAGFPLDLLHGRVQA